MRTRPRPSGLVGTPPTPLRVGGALESTPLASRLFWRAPCVACAPVPGLFGLPERACVRPQPSSCAPSLRVAVQLACLASLEDAVTNSIQSLLDSPLGLVTLTLADGRAAGFSSTLPLPLALSETQVCSLPPRVDVAQRARFSHWLGSQEPPSHPARLSIAPTGATSSDRTSSQPTPRGVSAGLASALCPAGSSEFFRRR